MTRRKYLVVRGLRNCRNVAYDTVSRITLSFSSSAFSLQVGRRRRGREEVNYCWPERRHSRPAVREALPVKITIVLRPQLGERQFTWDQRVGNKETHSYRHQGEGRGPSV